MHFILVQFGSVRFDWSWIIQHEFAKPKNEIHIGITMRKASSVNKTKTKRNWTDEASTRFKNWFPQNSTTHSIKSWLERDGINVTSTHTHTRSHMWAFLPCYGLNLNLWNWNMKKSHLSWFALANYVSVLLIYFGSIHALCKLCHFRVCVRQFEWGSH